MRITVEISDEQRVALTTLAVERGLRGFSPIVREAIAAYLQRDRAQSLEGLLSLRGSMSDESADRIEQIVAERRTGVRRSPSSSTPTS
jgi:metal-responsive CopG/Arc/MetJ family transcriptional regulator